VSFGLALMFAPLDGFIGSVLAVRITFRFLHGPRAGASALAFFAFYLAVVTPLTSGADSI
jgi:hypothetical protein